MQKLFQSLKVQDKSGNEVTLRSIIDSPGKTAFIVVFNRNQNTKHFCKVWSAKLEKLSGGALKTYKILAFKTSQDDIFKSSFDLAIKNFCCDEKDEKVFAVYGNCAKRIYNAAKLKTEDMVAVAVFGENKELIFMHAESYNEAAVKKLEAVI